MDTFVEQIIVRKKTGKDFAILAGILLGGCLLAAGSMIAFMMTGLSIIPMVAIVGICWGGYMLLGMRNIEYEYSFTNGDITVDKIIAKRKRKRVVSFDAKNVELIGEVGENTVKAGSEVKTVYRTGVLASGQGGWYIVYSRDGGSSKSMLLFSPNEKFIQALKPFLPARVRLDAFGRN